MILVIDNYDSFVHNLARYLEKLGQETCVVRNDAIDAAGARALGPAAIVLSPGPCTPQDSAGLLELIGALYQRIPLLGVCLGHQAIGVALGGKIARAPLPMHGRGSRITHNRRGLFSGLRNPLRVGRYHSLMLDRASLPDALAVTSWSGDGAIMSVAHRRWPVMGVQFHPESILTEAGYAMLANFLRIAGLPCARPVPSFAEELRGMERRRGSRPPFPVTF